MLKVKNTITEMENIFVGHNSRLNMDEKKERGKKKNSDI